MYAPSASSIPYCSRKFVPAILATLLLLVGSLNAQTFTTIGSGFINDASIWSTDGGATSCNCTPVSELPTVFVLNGGNCEINHNVFFTRDVIIMGSSVIININATGALTGTSSLDIRAGVVNNYGSLGASDVSVQNGGFLNNQDLMSVSPGDLVNLFQGRINLAGRTNIPNGNFTNDGIIDIRGSATVFVGLRIINNEFINMEPAACMQVIGDMNNVGTISLINGPGKAYIQSNSNILNVGTWDTDVNYCAAGTAVGLVHAMSCTSCGVLPVELAGFEATLDNGQVILDWETVAELDNSFFTVERSNDGTSFTELMEVSSSSPVSGRVYQTYDVDPFHGISYYRLSQTDQNGAREILETVLVNNAAEATHYFNAFPNPFQESIRVTTEGMEGQTISVQVLDLSGREVARRAIARTADFSVYEVPTQDLPAGMYMVVVTGNQVTESFKLLHN